VDPVDPDSDPQHFLLGRLDLPVLPEVRIRPPPPVGPEIAATGGFSTRSIPGHRNTALLRNEGISESLGLPLL
jgi:hypothetical protein